MRTMKGALAVLVAGSVLVLAGCAGPTTDGDKGMAKDKEMMMKDKEMMKKEGGTMKEDKSMMEKK